MSVQCSYSFLRGGTADGYFSEKSFHIIHKEGEHILKVDDELYEWQEGYLRGIKVTDERLVRIKKMKLPVFNLLVSGRENSRIATISCRELKDAKSRFIISDGVNFISLNDSMMAMHMKSRDALRVSDVAQIRIALLLYYYECGLYPETLTSKSECGSPGLSDFIEPIPADPITSEFYIYDTNDKQDVFCLGADLERGDSKFINTDTFVMPEGTHCTGGDYYVKPESE